MKRLLLVPFLLVLIFGCSNQKNTIYQRKIDCADATSGVISYHNFFKKYKLGRYDDKRDIYNDEVLLEEFCQFYKSK